MGLRQFGQLSLERAVAAQEFEAAERRRPDVPSETDGDVTGVDADVELRPGLVAVRLAGQRQPGAERLIPARPVQPGQMAVQRLFGPGGEPSLEVLTQLGK